MSMSTLKRKEKKTNQTYDDVQHIWYLVCVYVFSIQFSSRDGIRLINKYLLFTKNNINISKYL